MSRARIVTSRLRIAVTTMMVVLMLAFASAENRASVMTRLAEESGVGRFYEDKTHRINAAVVQLACEQHCPTVTDSGRPRAPRFSAAVPSMTGRTLRAMRARAPPHLPRAPPFSS
jgi:hypothetical protein